MTNDQKRAVNLYSMGTVVSFGILMWWLLIGNFGASLQRIFCRSEKDSLNDDESPVRYQDEAIDAYVAVVYRNELKDPVICCNVDDIPSINLPVPKGYWDTDISGQEFSVAVFDEFPFLDPATDGAYLKVICVKSPSWPSPY